MASRSSGRTTACRAPRGLPSTRTLRRTARTWCSARASGPRLIRTRRSTRTTAAPPPGLRGYLRGRGLSRLVFVGLATDFCVAWSAIDGAREGFEVAVVEDACRAIDLDGSLAAAWEEMAAAGVARVRTADL